MKNIIFSAILFIKLINMVFGQELIKPETTFNKELAATLDTIYQEDQKYRLESRKLEKLHGWDSKEVQNILKIIQEKDSINLIKVEKILENYGWLGSDIIGENGNRTLFLVIQHSKLEIQEKYLPIIKEAVRNGKAKASHAALMEDRVLIERGEKQIYGSQLEMDYKTKNYVLSPMIDPDNVDKRRSEVGLQPISEYLKNWDLIWDAEEFKKRMEDLESKKATH